MAVSRLFAGYICNTDPPFPRWLGVMYLRKEDELRRGRRGTSLVVEHDLHGAQVVIMSENHRICMRMIENASNRLKINQNAPMLCFLAMLCPISGEIFDQFGRHPKIDF